MNKEANENKAIKPTNTKLEKINKVDNQNMKLNIHYISLGAGVMSGFYQYNLLEKSKFTQPARFLVCTLTAGFCYGLTKMILKNVNEL
jgi:hypothetical protein